MTETHRPPAERERTSGSAKKPGIGARLGLFYRQVIAELRKVVWPTQQQLITYFIVVLVFVLVIMTIVSLLDLAFGRLVFKVFA